MEQPIVFENTKDIATAYVKVLVHGPAGAGKTRLCGTTGDKTLIINAEGGLLSLRGQEIDVYTIRTLADLRRIYQYLTSDTTFKWVCLDSISEVAEVVLAAEKQNTKDPRKAYGEMAETMAEMIRCFRDLPKNVYFSAKQDRLKDDVSGSIVFGPSAPGQKLGVSLPYFFDIVMALHTWKDESGEIKSGLQTRRDAQYEAKDRSGCLDMLEPADLSIIHSKIMKGN